MPVTSFEKDPAALTLTLTAELAAPPERVWQVWADPRQLERWWGPPGYPATVEEHSLEPGGIVSYYMSGPDGERYPGWWRVLAVEEPTRFEFEDGFTDEEGNPDDSLPSAITTVTLRDTGRGATTMVMVSTFPTLAQMEEILAMGAEEGIVSGAGQIDAILAES